MIGNVAEAAIGAAVLAVAAGFLVYAGQHAALESGGAYELSAQFRKAEGVTVGGDVRISGVKVGTVRSLSLDPESFQARVTMSIDPAVTLPDDSSATIASDGLLGGAHVAIQPGGSDLALQAGDEILYTQGSVSILDLVGRAISGGGE